MLAVFEKGVANPPEELSLPAAGRPSLRARKEIAEIFQSWRRDSTLYGLSNGNFMALSHEGEFPLHPSPKDGFAPRETDGSYIPQLGEQVYVKALGNKLATVVEAPGDDDAVLVQYGKIRVRVNISSLRAISNSERNAASSNVPQLKRQAQGSRNFRNASEASNVEANSYGPAIQTSKNTVDLRGMRVEEASHHLNIAISARAPNSVLFIIHGMGTGVVKECVLEILRKHPRIAKFEQESPMNYGCTVAYIK
ncbi:unnamed protein product [Ilex paraguariensis]|uniref:Smr domain-containing protein n=1 Tax=Ilex paraguariensis TaxID=185542 RepID=A0ABC8ULD3_9AQUA